MIINSLLDTFSFLSLILCVASSAFFLGFYPLLTYFSRAPLLKYLGLKFDRVTVLPLKLTLSINKLLLLPSESIFLRSIFVAIFPSAHVKRLHQAHRDFPESTISVELFSVKIRIGSVANFIRDIQHDNSLNVEQHVTPPTQDSKKIHWIYHFIPRPIVVLTLSGVRINVEKAYLAPKPPSSLSRSKTNCLPSAIPPSEFDASDLPKFDQDSFLSILENEEIIAADEITFLIERWIEHHISKRKLRKFGNSINEGTDKLDNEANSRSEELHAEQTFDERFNATISFVAALLLYSISVNLQHVSIVISGARAEFVKTTRRKFGPRIANVYFAKLPWKKRALTTVNADLISLTFNSGTRCIGSLCFVGLNAKIGYPMFGSDNIDLASGTDNRNDLKYAWYTIVHPFQLVTEVKGIIPVIIWAVNYDHNWEKKSLGLTFHSTEIAIAVSSSHLHTALLHLDDYTDGNSPINEWMQWLNTEFQRSFNIDENEKIDYYLSYAGLKGVELKGVSDKGDRSLSVTQLRNLEKRMSRHEIIMLRCIAMKSVWRIPRSKNTDNSSDELSLFLDISNSTIGMKESSTEVSNNKPLSPFQNVYSSQLNALTSLIQEKFSILAPKFEVQCFLPTLNLDFPNQKEKPIELSIPSSIALINVSFFLDIMNPLSPQAKISHSIESPRSLLNLSIQISEIEWIVLSPDSGMTHLPVFWDKTPVGVIYKRREITRSNQVINFEFSLHVSPTVKMEYHFFLKAEVCNFAIVLNPFPLLSFLQTLLDLSDLPFQVLNETNTNDVLLSLKSNDDLSAMKPEQNMNYKLPNITAVIRIEDSSILLMADKDTLSHGILDLNIGKISTTLNTSEFLGSLTVTTEPVELSAGQVKHKQAGEKLLLWNVMPLKPILRVKGTKIVVCTEGKKNAITIESPLEVVAISISLEISVEHVELNLSPAIIVSLQGVFCSLKPFLLWSSIKHNVHDVIHVELDSEKLMKEQQSKLQSRRDALWKIFQSIDVDNSNTIQESELELFINKMHQENEFFSFDELHGTHWLTSGELKREKQYLISILDQARSDEISFKEIDSFLFRMANKIDDINLIPKIKLYDDYYLKDFINADYFLSAPYLRKLVQFTNLREHSSMHEVYRITGCFEYDTTFPAPHLWRHGEGIELFWELYTSETGCSRDSLNGQDIAVVQRKLVRLMCNYEFAKFCWNTLIQPQLRGTTGKSEEKVKDVVSCWIIDCDSKSNFNIDILDRIQKHVETMSEASNISPRLRSVGYNFWYDLSFVIKVNEALLRFGSLYTFANPLLEVTFRHVEIGSIGRLSQNGSFFSAMEDNEAENKVCIQSNFSALYLNTKRDYMERFIEPFPFYGCATYKNVNPCNEDDSESASFSLSVNVHCSRFLNINASPSLFETLSILNKIVSESDPETFHTKIFERTARFVRNIWDTNEDAGARSDLLSVYEATAAIRAAADSHWRDEMVGLTREEREHMIVSFISLVDKDTDEMISFSSIENALKKYSSRCYFSGCSELQVENNVGRQIWVSTQSKCSPTIQPNLQVVDESFHAVDDGNTTFIPFREYSTKMSLSGRQDLKESLSIVIPGYKAISDIIISPYQSLMFALKLPKNSKKRKVRRKKRNASGFMPYITVVPKSVSLDSISLELRTCVAIRSDIPIKIRLVRLSKTLSNVRNGTRSKIDLSKKNLTLTLKRLVEGAAIVSEVRIHAEESTVPLHLGVIDSSFYHALLVQDQKSDSWRDPLLLTKEFLHNPLHLSEVMRCHALTGVIIHKERLNVHTPTETLLNDKERIMRSTAWDTIIHVVPSFLLSNSLPFPLLIRTRQLSEEDEEDLLQDHLLFLASSSAIDEDSGSEDENSELTWRSVPRAYLGEFHQSNGSEQNDYYSMNRVEAFQTVPLNGINLSLPIYLQACQDVLSSDAIEESGLMWSNSAEIRLDKLRTGANRKGSYSVLKLILDLGDDVDALIDVSIDSTIRTPTCNIYSPYWINNKTGIKMEYKISDQSKCYIDSGMGGIPIMMHGAKSIDTNRAYTNVSREISVVPLECPNEEIATSWWDEVSNGKLVLQKNQINSKGINLVEWSDKIELDAVGTSDELNCKSIILNVSIESFVGVLHRSNAITLSPRFIVKNMMHIPMSIMPLIGTLHDVKRHLFKLRGHSIQYDDEFKVDLNPGESTVLYKFKTVLWESVEKQLRWVAFRVNAARWSSILKPKWHLIPMHMTGSIYFGEHDGCIDTMCGILIAKVHRSDEGSILTSICHAAVPPICIENRTQSHYLQFVQDDDEALVFELPPMHSCGYTWDSPLGKKELLAVVISEIETRGYHLAQSMIRDRSDGLELDEEETSFVGYLSGATMGDGLRSAGHGLKNFKKKNQKPYLYSKFKRLLSRGYSISKPGRQKDLDFKMSRDDGRGYTSKLFVHMRISAGTKVLSFSDSPFLSNEVELGNLRKGGEFKYAECDINVAGVGLYLMDDFPRELLSIIVRDFQIQKLNGSIEAFVRARHIQVDAMVWNARYPTIIQPLPLGVDRREPLFPKTNENGDISHTNMGKNDYYWTAHDEKPIPVIEILCSYVPQTNMTWVPNLTFMMSPMKLQIDIDYILRITGIVMHAVTKNRDYPTKRSMVKCNINDKLQYLTQSQTSIFLTYIEKLYIAPVFFEIELNIKPDESDDTEFNYMDEPLLTLHTIGQLTESVFVAGILSWVINVGANFAHVSPRFSYNDLTETDRYCDFVDLVKDIFISYVVQTIKQSYKVVFSMHLLGDPSQLAHQVKTGVSDLFFKTRDEVLAGGKDGVGKGVASFVHNVFGGLFFAGGKLTGGVAETIDSVVTNRYSSDYLKPKALAAGNTPHNAVEGVVQGTEYFGRTIIHGLAGVIGNPYRGITSGRVSGVTKGIASGVTGLVVAPFVGALGFVAKAAEGLGEGTKILTIGVIEARCRPSRSVSWGCPMIDIGLSYLKAIGIRIHTVRYQKVRKRFILQKDGDMKDLLTSREYKRAKAAEDRRKNPPLKAISIVHNKQKQHYFTSAAKPQLLSDHPGHLAVSHYAVPFEQIVIIRTPDLQLADQVIINFWNNKHLKIATTKSKPLAMCILSMSDIYASILIFYREQLKKRESALSENFSIHSQSRETKEDHIVIPAPQEICLFRPYKSTVQSNVSESVNDEIRAIEKQEEDALNGFDSDSFDSESDTSFLNCEKKVKKDNDTLPIKSNEILYGSISLSFFPIPW